MEVDQKLSQILKASKLVTKISYNLYKGAKAITVLPEKRRVVKSNSEAWCLVRDQKNHSEKLKKLLQQVSTLLIHSLNSILWTISISRLIIKWKHLDYPSQNLAEETNHYLNHFKELSLKKQN